MKTILSSEPILLNDIAYTVRPSLRCKSMHIKISPKRGVEVVVPVKRTPPQKKINQFVNQHADWIRFHSSKIIPVTVKDTIIDLPIELELRAIQETWKIEWISDQNANLRLFPHDNKNLMIVGDLSEVQLCCRIIIEWLKTVAYRFFSLWLRELSLSTQLKYSSLTIRQNSTRWGSCSSRKRISLCCKLLFLPEELTRHVLLHELCHTQQMNHGPTFKQLLQSVDPHAQLHAWQLKDTSKYIPKWLKIIKD